VFKRILKRGEKDKKKTNYLQVAPSLRKAEPKSIYELKNVVDSSLIFSVTLGESDRKIREMVKVMLANESLGMRRAAGVWKMSWSRGSGTSVILNPNGRIPTKKGGAVKGVVKGPVEGAEGGRVTDSSHRGSRHRSSADFREFSKSARLLPPNGECGSLAM
jgi:hypothetical protein